MYWVLLLIPLFVLVCFLLSTRIPAWWIPPSYSAKCSELQRQNERKLLAEGGRLDHFTLIGTHNSCHRANLFGGLAVPRWRYSHHPLLAQLELGIRHIEIDLWYNSTSTQWQVRASEVHA